MVPQLLWILALLVAGALAWRSMTQGGPIADWFWVGVGGLALAFFGGEIFKAVPVLWAAFATENAWAPNPVIHTHVAVLVALVFFRPHRGHDGKVTL